MKTSAILRTAYALSIAVAPVYVARPDDPTIKRWTNPKVSKRTVLDVLFRESKRADRPASSHARAFSHRER